MRILRALRRVAGAPFLVLGVVLFHLGTSKLISSTFRATVAGNLSPYSIPDGQSLLYALLEQFMDHPGILAGLRQQLMFAGLLSLLLWTALAGGIFHRLARREHFERMAIHTVRFLPGMFAVTLWHLIPRLVLLGLAGALTRRLMDHNPWGWLAAFITLLLLFYCTCALDLARASIVLNGARPFAWQTAWRGFTRAARRPSVLIASLMFSLGQWITVLALVYVAIAGFAEGLGVWPARLLSVLGIVCSLGRMAVAVDALSPAALLTNPKSTE